MRKVLLFSIFGFLLAGVSCTRFSQTRSTRSARQAITGTWIRQGTRAVEVVTGTGEITRVITRELNERKPCAYSETIGPDIYIFEENGIASTTFLADVMYNGKYHIHGNDWILELPLKTVEGRIDTKAEVLLIFNDETEYFRHIYPKGGVKKVISAAEYIKK